MHCVRESSSLTQGLRRELFKTITSKEEHALQRIWRWKDFLLAVHKQGGADQANWMPCRCPHGPRTFSSGWIWIKTSRPMLHTDSSSLQPPTHAARQAPKLELPALVSSNIRWFQGQTLSLWSSCLQIPSVSWMQLSTSLSTTQWKSRACLLQL